MTVSVEIVCSPRLAPGFGLAGARALTAGDGLAVAARIAELRRRGGVGVILVEEELLDRLPSDLAASLARQAPPFVVPFPSPDWTRPSTAESRVVEILRQAIGYRITLR